MGQMTQGRYFEDFSVGEALTSSRRTITEADVVNFAGLSGDFNPLHYDDEFARSAGLPGVMAHGMFSAGLLGSFLVSWVEDRRVRRFKLRFKSPVWPGDTLHATGSLVRVDPSGDIEVAELVLKLARQDGSEVVTAMAEVECA